VIPLADLVGAVKSSDVVKIRKKDGSFEFTGKLDLSGREREILQAAGLLSFTRQRAHG
jgi:hypothetical protein